MTGPAAAEEPAARLLDERLGGVAQAAPAFGGMFVGPDGRLKVYVLDPAAGPDAVQAIITEFGLDRIPDAGIEILTGQYGFADLKGWHALTLSLFAIEGVILTDLDEARNRVVVGVEHAGLSVAVERELARLGIPREAVLIEVTDPIRPVQALTLRSSIRPVQGGLQINFFSGRSSYACTLGFNAVRNGVAGFVTNSHCTAKQGGVESTLYYQPARSSDPSAIGTETVDPVYRTGIEGCPSGKTCRFSDSAFAACNGTACAGSDIAKTTGPNNGSLTIAGKLSLVSEAAAVVGDTLNKVGRTTGWTQGRVSRTCAHTGVLGSKIVQLCQNHVGAGVDSGDSGSPVWAGVSDPESVNSAILHGILWGGGSSSFVYSPIANVQRGDELGTLTNCAAPAPTDENPNPVPPC